MFSERNCTRRTRRSFFPRENIHDECNNGSREQISLDRIFVRFRSTTYFHDKRFCNIRCKFSLSLCLSLSFLLKGMTRFTQDQATTLFKFFCMIRISDLLISPNFVGKVSAKKRENLHKEVSKHARLNAFQSFEWDCESLVGDMLPMSPG